MTIYLVVGFNSMLGVFSTWAFSSLKAAEAFQSSEDCLYISDETAIRELVIDEKVVDKI